MSDAGTSIISDDTIDHAQQKRIVSEVFPCLLDIGEAMLKCGADVHTVEQALVRAGKAYGAERMNVLVITAVIIVTVTYRGFYERTFTRRVVGEGGTDFAKLELLARLCNECANNPMPAKQLESKLAAIKSRKFPRISLYLGGALSSGGFAVFFGGSVVDGVVSALFALLVCVAIKHFKPLTPNTIVFNFATSLPSGIAICAVAAMFHQINVNMVIIGVIMLLIPGVAMTNATRDMLSGDTISGVMRFIESLLWATSLALGFMVALWVASMVGWTYSWSAASIDWPFALMILITTISALGFALFFGVRPRHIPIATLGGVATWAIFNFFSIRISNVFVPTLIASTFAAIYAEVLARRLKVPNAVFFIIAVIPLVPGRGLYYTMYSAVNMDWTSCYSYALTTLLYSAGIAVGICLIAAVVQTWDLWSARHEKAAKVIIGAEQTVVKTGKKVARAVVPLPPIKHRKSESKKEDASKDSAAAEKKTSASSAAEAEKPPANDAADVEKPPASGTIEREKAPKGASDGSEGEPAK